MLHTIVRAGASAVLALAALSAQADILVGDYRGANPGDIGPLLRFGPQQNGDQAPLATLITDGPGGSLRTPLAATYEPVEDVVYVSDYWGRAIHVYPAGASGNVGPLRKITSSQLGQPRTTAVDVAHDELFAIVSNCCIAAFARTADGAPVPRRQVSWGGSSGPSRLNNPAELLYLPATDELVVADVPQRPGGVGTGALLFFARTANGDAAPLRTIEGAATRLGDYVAGLAYDAARGELIALAREGGAYHLATFAEAASGNVVPTRVIEGPDLRIENPGAIAYDPATDLVYVATGANTPNPAVLAFPRTASGNVAPVRVLAGLRTGITSPGALVVVPAGDGIFRDGFE